MDWSKQVTRFYNADEAWSSLPEAGQDDAPRRRQRRGFEVPPDPDDNGEPILLAGMVAEASELEQLSVFQTPERPDLEHRATQSSPPACSAAEGPQPVSRPALCSLNRQLIGQVLDLIEVNLADVENRGELSQATLSRLSGLLTVSSQLSQLAGQKTQLAALEELGRMAGAGVPQSARSRTRLMLSMRSSISILRQLLQTV